MTKEELELLAKTIEEASNNDGLIYTIIIALTVTAPLIAFIFKSAFKKAVNKVITETIAPQIKLVRDIVDARKTEQEQMFSIMEMHIEELRHIGEKQLNLEDAQNKIKKKVASNTRAIKIIKAS
jgi:hypothetical protein